MYQTGSIVHSDLCYCSPCVPFGELKCLLETALIMAASSQCSRTFITFHSIDGYTSEWFILSKRSSVLFSEELPIKASH